MHLWKNALTCFTPELLAALPLLRMLSQSRFCVSLQKNLRLKLKLPSPHLLCNDKILRCYLEIT